MPNGDGPSIDINIGIDVFPFPGRPPSPRDRRQERDPAFGGPGSLPFRAPPRPTIPGVPPATNPFGIPGIAPPSTLPQGSDVVFKRGVTFGAGRLFGVGGLIVAAAELLIFGLETAQQKKIREEAAAADEAAAEDLRNRRRREARDTPVVIDQTVATVDFPMAPPDVPLEPFRVFPPFRLPERLPPAPATEPLPEVLPGQVPLEVAIPVPSRITTPVAPPAIASPPVPAASPVEVPGTFEPAQLPGVASPVSTPASFSTSQILADLLTRSEAGSVPSVGSITGVGSGTELGTDAQSRLQATAQTAPAPVGVNTCPPPRQCDDELEEPRIECFKGLYREGIFDTDFTPWNEIDCITGTEL